MAYFQSKKILGKMGGAIANRSGQKAFNTSMAAAKAAGHGVGKATAAAVASSDAAIAKAMPRAMSTSKKMYYGGAAAVGIGGAMAMRPNANQSRTAYRGPMQTGRGVGRFA